jgi:hypothetical protein
MLTTEGSLHANFSPDLCELYLHLGPEEVERLERFFTRWAAILLRIYESVAGDPEIEAEFLALTSRGEEPTISEKVDSSKATKP